MLDTKLIPAEFKITEEDLKNTPPSVLLLLTYSIKQNMELKNRVDQLEARLNMNSSNSSQPPSSDNKLTKRPTNKKTKGKAGGKPGHKGSRLQLLEPTEVKVLVPEKCSCGNSEFQGQVPYYTHQLIELPEIALFVTHFVLYRGICTCCGKLNKALVPENCRTGYVSISAVEDRGNRHISGRGKTSLNDFIAFKEKWIVNELYSIPEDIQIFKLLDDTMEPTLKCGDMVLINHKVCDGQNSPCSDGLYLLNIEDRLTIKRLQLLPDNLVQVVSDNLAYKPYLLDLSKLSAKTRIVGRVMWAGKKMI